jgi:hypothetical protein
MVRYCAWVRGFSSRCDSHCSANSPNLNGFAFGGAHEPRIMSARIVER